MKRLPEEWVPSPADVEKMRAGNAGMAAEMVAEINATMGTPDWSERNVRRGFDVDKFFDRQKEAHWLASRYPERVVELFRRYGLKDARKAGGKG